MLKALDSREDDSKRIDAILSAIIEFASSTKNPTLYFPNGYTAWYDSEFKVWVAGSHEINTTTFKDGREAIDFCLHNDEQEALEREFYASSNHSENSDKKEENK